jgi:hypothetical protein
MQKNALDTLEFALYNWRKAHMQDFALAFALAHGTWEFLHLLLHWRRGAQGKLARLVTIRFLVTKNF